MTGALLKLTYNYYWEGDDPDDKREVTQASMEILRSWFANEPCSAELCQAIIDAMAESSGDYALFAAALLEKVATSCTELLRDQLEEIISLPAIFFDLFGDNTTPQDLTDKAEELGVDVTKPQYRQNDCWFEASYDNGETWEPQFQFDGTACPTLKGETGDTGETGPAGPAPDMREFEDGGDTVIQYYDEVTMQWVTLVNVTEVVESVPIDCQQVLECTEGGIEIPPPTPDPGEDAACILAEAIAEYLTDIRDDVSAMLDVGTTATGLATGVFSIASVFTAGASLAPVLFMGGCMLIAAAGKQAFDETVTDDVISEIKCEAYTLINAAGAYNNLVHNDLIDFIATEYAGTVTDPLFWNAINGIGVSGVNNIPAWYNITAGDCQACAPVSPMVIVGASEWPGYQTVSDLGDNRFTVNSDYGDTVCYVAGFEADGGINDGFYITENHGYSPPTPAGCNSNKALRLYEQGSTTPLQIGTWNELLGWPTKVWKVLVWSNQADFTLDFTIGDTR